MTRAASVIGDRRMMPLPTAESSRFAAPPRPRLLLVDDNADGRIALAHLMRLYGYDVTAVADGMSALLALGQEPPPDVVLTDLLLPDIDGREVARVAHALRPTPVVVMITGWDLGADAMDARNWGIDHVFLKPLDVAQLVSTINTPSA